MYQIIKSLERRGEKLDYLPTLAKHVPLYSQTHNALVRSAESALDDWRRCWIQRMVRALLTSVFSGDWAHQSLLLFAP
jgi:hypothetical protein